MSIFYTVSLCLWLCATVCVQAKSLTEALGDYAGALAKLTSTLKPSYITIHSHRSLFNIKSASEEKNPADMSIKTINIHDAPVSSIAYNSDGSLIASGSFDKTIKIADTNFSNF